MSAEKRPEWAVILNELYQIRLTDEGYIWGVSQGEVPENSSLDEKIAESQVDALSKKIGQKSAETELILDEMNKVGLLYAPTVGLVTHDGEPIKNREQAESDLFGPNPSSTWTLTEKGFDVAHQREIKKQEHRHNDNIVFLTIALVATGILQSSTLALTDNSETGFILSLGIIFISFVLTALLAYSWHQDEF